MSHWNDDYLLLSRTSQAPDPIVPQTGTGTIYTNEWIDCKDSLELPTGTRCTRMDSWVSIIYEQGSKQNLESRDLRDLSIIYEN